MGVKVYYSEISGQKEVKKRQQRVMMILDSKQVPYEAIDITDPARETDKEFMLTTAKPRGDAKYVLSPQIFNEEVYCGDFDDFELANENDELEAFLGCPKAENNNVKVTNGTSRGSSADAEAKPAEAEAEAQPVENSAPVESEEPAPSSETPTTTSDEKEKPAAEEPTSTETDAAPVESTAVDGEEAEEEDE